jgi:putative transposase
MESPRNARNMASASWRKFLTFLDHAAEKHACHVVQVDPRGTTKECASCGVETEKPLWVREHSCPACGYTDNRDFNAAANILHRGLDELGVVHSESTPVETATAASTDGGRESVAVDASRVAEAGSRALKEPTAVGE